MKLKVRNFAKIKEADIIFDGITVIAGRNNTGKSTVGKILYSMYNATSNLEQKMEAIKKSRIQNVLRQTHIEHFYPPYIRDASDRILNAQNQDEEKGILVQLADFMFTKLDESEKDSVVQEWYQGIQKVKGISDESFTQAILTNYFRDMFNGQLNYTEDREKVARVEVSTKSGNNRVTFQNDMCLGYSFEYATTNNAVYIDNPVLLDKLNNFEVMSNPKKYLSEQEYDLYVKLKGKKESAEERAIDEIINEEKLKDILMVLDKAIPGDITYNQKYLYQTDKSKNGIDIRSLSTGLKSFAMLKQIIMNGSLNNKDAIILDEPEIHLHPEWQMVYAELIVVLQEKFDFNIVINTHSSHFLETLDFYAQKYGSKQKCHYYLSEEMEEMCSFKEVTETPEKIYKQLIDPSLLLSREKEIWEDTHEQVLR